MAAFAEVFGLVGPTIVALAVTILNCRDRLADKVNDLAERLARIEGILLEVQATRPSSSGQGP